MLVPAAITDAAAFLALNEPDHGTTRRYAVTLTNGATGQSEVVAVDADNVIRAKGIAQLRMTMRLMGAPLTADVVRSDA